MKWALASLVLAPQALANDGWWAATGEFGGFGQHDQIQMVSEAIRIELGERFANVAVEFSFKNHGNACVATLGFPEEYAGPMERGLDHFVTTVDGEPHPVRREVVEADEEERVWQAVWLKDVTFDEGQSRTVEVRYRAEYAGDTGGRRRLSYVMRTGATWFRDLEKCEIYVTWQGWPYGPPIVGFSDNDPERQQVFRRTGRERIEATLQNLEPDFDLVISFTESFWNFEIDGHRVATEAYVDLSGHPRDPQIDLGNPIYLGMLFGGYEEGVWRSWGFPGLSLLGGEFMLDSGAIVFADGRRSPLARGELRRKNRRGDDGIFVHVRDLAEALGGSYTYDEEEQVGRIELTAASPADPVEQSETAAPAGSRSMMWIAGAFGMLAIVVVSLFAWTRRKAA